MFGISPIGWVHTLGSLPAIPLAATMFARHGRIVPRSPTGLAYLGFMLVGAGTVFAVAHQPVSYVIGSVTLAALLAGFALSRLRPRPRLLVAAETACLSFSAFLLMLPTVTEILRRVPDGHPLVTNPKAPLLLGAQATVLALFVIGLGAQMVHLLRHRPVHD